MHLSQLRWLEGFAADGRWYVVGGEPAVVVPDGLAVSRARRTVNTLGRDYREALAKLVGDAAAWQARIDRVLTSLGHHVHGRAVAEDIGTLARPRVRRTVRALEGAHPALHALLRAATSAWILWPDVLETVITWMKAHVRTMTALVDGAGPRDLRRLLELARLAAEDEPATSAVLELMLIDIPDPAHTTAQLGNLIGRLNGGHNVTAPAPQRSDATVLPWVDDLLGRPPADRARAVRLMAVVDIAGALGPWRAWEVAHAARIERALAFAARGNDRGPTMDHFKRLVAGLHRAQAALPAVIPLRELLSDVTALAEPGHEPFHRALVRLLTVLPAGDSPLARTLFVRHAAAVAADADQDRRAAGLWEALALELRAGAPERVLGPWNEVLAGKPQAWLEHDLLRHSQRPAEVRRFAAALARLAREVPVSAEDARRLGSAMAGGLDVEDAVALVCRLQATEVQPSPHLVRAAVALAGRDATALAGLLPVLYSLSAELGKDGEKTLAGLCEHATATGSGWLIRGLLDHDTRGLINLAELGKLVPRRSWPRLESDSPMPRWIGSYPAVLADALARLARVDPDAEGTARRRLATALPDRAALEREAATLRARVPLGEREARRLHNLEARIAAPRPPKPGPLARLAAKLESAARRIGAARCAASLSAAAQARIAAALGLEAWPVSTVDGTQWSTLVALIHLDPGQRALAGRLLRARSGPAPRDLRDDPVNRAFMARLRGLGVDPSPWLDDTPRVVGAGDGQPLELGFCSDPLEVFAMGVHFHTCLAPDGGNFFSVVTNAADVNKRVLYARRGGKVVGRCLLALTDAGHVLTFHPYSHDKRLGFDALVRDYAADLAAHMGTGVSTGGQVTTLLGRDWYDDGAVDLVGRFGALASPEFAAAIQAVVPSGLIALLEKTLQHPLDDITLPVVLAVPALAARPELIEPLASHLLARPTLPDVTLMSAARLAMQAGDLALADRLLDASAPWTPFEDGAWHLGQVLARTRPSFTLARLRQTRRRGVRRWEDERGERLAVAGLALEMLRRPRQAATLYRRAMTDVVWLADDLGPRLAALEPSRRTETS